MQRSIHKSDDGGEGIKFKKPIVRYSSWSLNQILVIPHGFLLGINRKREVGYSTENKKKKSQKDKGMVSERDWVSIFGSGSTHQVVPKILIEIQ